jgi:hypothetical protein
MNTKFTEGKWTAFIGNGVIAIDDSQGRAIINWPGFDGECFSFSKKKANAHLIAAAPDMYAMLEMLVNGDSINDHSIEKEVISLLTKARGELK